MALPRRAAHSRQTPHREPCHAAHHPPEAIASGLRIPWLPRLRFPLPHARPAPRRSGVTADSSRPALRSTELVLAEKENRLHFCTGKLRANPLLLTC